MQKTCCFFKKFKETTSIGYLSYSKLPYDSLRFGNALDKNFDFNASFLLLETKKLDQ